MPEKHSLYGLPGWSYTVEVDGRMEKQFMLWRPEGDSGPRVTVEKPGGYSYRENARVQVGGAESAEEALALAALLEVAYTAAQAAEDDPEWRAEVARRMAEREERQRIREEERQAKIARNEAFREALQWHVGDWVRVAREGKRSFVKGTIDLADRFSLEVTTERNQPMSLNYRDITSVEYQHTRGEGEFKKISLPS